MKTLKVSELSGPALAFAVGLLIGVPRLIYAHGTVFGGGGAYKYRPDYKWDCGGPIIEEECIELVPWNDGDRWSWSAKAVAAGDYDEAPEGFGETALEAAMRCYVVSKLGEEFHILAGNEWPADLT